MPVTETFTAQKKLAAYCRTGELVSIPGIRERHVHHYRRLVFSVVKDSLDAAYPLTRNLLKPMEWDDLAHRFFRDHPCESAMVWQMPQELIPYVSDHQGDLIKNYPHLLDLLSFEWAEVEVFMMADLNPSGIKEKGELKKDRLQINKELKLLKLDYPVHLKNARYITPTDKGDHFAVLHRHPDSSKVIFTRINLPHYHLLQMMNEGTTYDAMLQLFREYAPKREAEAALQAFVEAAMQSKLILGFNN